MVSSVGFFELGETVVTKVTLCFCVFVPQELFCVAFGVSEVVLPES